MIVLPYKTLTVVAGCRAHDVRAHQTAYVIEARNLGADYGHTVSLTVEIAGRKHGYTVRHENRLNDASFNAHKGNPLEKVTFAPSKSRT